MCQHAQEHAMKVQVAERVTEHLPRGLGPEAAAVEVAPPDQQVKSPRDGAPDRCRSG